MMMSGARSMKVPRTRSIAIISSSTTFLSLAIPVSTFDGGRRHLRGTRSSQPNEAAAPMTNRMSRRWSGTGARAGGDEDSRKRDCGRRWPVTATAYTTAIDALSTAVNTPPRMPPKMIATSSSVFWECPDESTRHHAETGECRAQTPCPA